MSTSPCSKTEHGPHPPSPSTAHTHAQGDLSDAEKRLSQSTQTPSTPPPAPSRPSEWTLTSTLQVIGSFSLWINSWAISNSFGEFQTYYTTTLLPSHSASAISWIGSLQAFLLLFLGVLAGPLWDKGYWRWLIGVGNFCVVFGLMMTREILGLDLGSSVFKDHGGRGAFKADTVRFSLATEYWQIILAQGILCGIGCGCLFLPAIAILPQYFSKRRNLAAGVAATGSGVGGVIYPILLHRLLPRVGFPWAVRVLAFVTLFFAIISLLTLRNSLPPLPHGRKLIDVGSMRDVPLMLFAAAVFFIMAGVYNPVFYVEIFSLSFISDQNLAFYLLPILQAANILGRVLPSFFADRTGSLNMVVPALGTGCVLAFAWIGVVNEGGVIAWAVLYGMFFGLVQSIAPTCVVALTDKVQLLGTRLGICFAIGSLGILVGPPIAGAILNDTGHFLGLQIFTGVLISAALGFALAARVAKVGWGMRKL